MAKGFNAFNFLLGILLLILGIITFVFPAPAFWVILIIVSVGMLILGIAIIIETVNNEDANQLAKILAFVFGILLIIFGLIIIIGLLIDHESAAVIFLILLAIDMIVLGVFRIIAGITANEFPMWFRIFSVIIGILMVVFAILIFITPVWGAIFVIVYIGMVLVIAGIMRLVMAFLPE